MDVTLSNVTRQYFQGLPAGLEAPPQGANDRPETNNTNGGSYWPTPRGPEAVLLEPQPHIIHKPSISIGNDPPMTTPSPSSNIPAVVKQPVDTRPNSRASYESIPSERSTPQSYIAGRSSSEPSVRQRVPFPYPQQFTAPQTPMQMKSAPHNETILQPKHNYSSTQQPVRQMVPQQVYPAQSHSTSSQHVSNNVYSTNQRHNYMQYNNQSTQQSLPQVHSQSVPSHHFPSPSQHSTNHSQSAPHAHMSSIRPTHTPSPQHSTHHQSSHHPPVPPKHVATIPVKPLQPPQQHSQSHMQQHPQQQAAQQHTQSHSQIQHNLQHSSQHSQHHHTPAHAQHHTPQQHTHVPQQNQQHVQHLTLPQSQSHQQQQQQMANQVPSYMVQNSKHSSNTNNVSHKIPTTHGTVPIQKQQYNSYSHPATAHQSQLTSTNLQQMYSYPVQTSQSQRTNHGYNSHVNKSAHVPEEYSKMAQYPATTRSAHSALMAPAIPPSSRRSKESVQKLTNHRHRSQPFSVVPNTSTTTTVAHNSTKVSTEYPQNHRYSQASTPTTVVHYSRAGQTYPYTTMSSHHSLGSSTTSTMASSYQPIAPVAPYHQSSKQTQAANQYPDQLRQLTKHVYNLPASRSNHMPSPHPVNGIQVDPTLQEPSIAAGRSLQKRESPLDLSVKTVRTTADSTGQEDSEYSDIYRRDKYNSAASSGRAMIPSLQQPSSVAYPTFEVGRSNNQMRMPLSAAPNLSSPNAHKVDFLPNFTSSTLNNSSTGASSQDNRQIAHSHTSDNKQPSSNGTLPHMSTFKKYENQMQNYQHALVNHQPRYPNNIRAGNVHPEQIQIQDHRNHMYANQMYSKNTKELQRKRLPEPIVPYGVSPPKIQKVEPYRVEKKIPDVPSTLPSSVEAHHISKQHQVINGNGIPQQHEYYKRLPYAHQFTAPQRVHSQPYIPVVSAHQQHPSTNNTRQPLSRTSSNPKLSQTNHPVQGADKRVINLLRDSLQTKEAEKQKLTLELSRINENRRQSSATQPNIDVTMSTQPNSNIVGRHNLPPFASAAILDRKSNTSPLYKLQMPRAVDSIKFESDNSNSKTISVEEEFTNSNIKVPLKEQENERIQPPTTDSEGIEALIAARIRTKAELKGFIQTSEVNQNNQSKTAVVPTLTVPPIQKSTLNIPKVNVEKTPLVVPRKRLFSRSEDDQTAVVECTQLTQLIVPLATGAQLPSRDPSGIRSSSETSIFDFRESDSEPEMVGFERQSLHEMRRRRSSVKQNTDGKDGLEQLEFKPLIEDIKQEIEPDNIFIESKEDDSIWTDALEKFLEQLQTKSGKKRGRRKKIESENIKLETVSKETPLIDVKIEQTVVVNVVDIVKTENKCYGLLGKIKQESSESLENVPQPNEEKKPAEAKPATDSDSDEDLPLSKRKLTIKTEPKYSDGEEDVQPSKRKDKITITEIKKESSSSSSSSSDSEDEGSSTIANRLRKRNNNKQAKQNESDKMTLRSRDTTPNKLNATPAKKFGDGSDFYPGWEEEVYNYKRSLRMPAQLINITRPPHFHRLSTSLPDLDPCPSSPTPSLLPDILEPPPSTKLKSVSVNIFGTKPKRDFIDSDIDSNSSFSFNQKNEDSEASSSTIMSSVNKLNKSINTRENNNSILDVLVQKYTPKPIRKRKVKEQKLNIPKVIPKSEMPLELLATPSLGLGFDKTGKSKSPVKSKKALAEVCEDNSVYLGTFRKQTITNFRQAFLSNTNGLLGATEEFNPVVLKSRTRTETRVLKQRATIREVFGEDRPASAPPMSLHADDSSQDSQTEIQPPITAAPQSGSRTPVKPLASKRSAVNFLKTLATRKLKLEQDQEDTPLKDLAKQLEKSAPTEENNGVVPMDTSAVADGDDESTPEINKNPGKKKIKMRGVRRKFSSGFDYIRKKKKVPKKDDSATGEQAIGKPKRGRFYSKPSPESVNDIQREIKGWVINKGIGETHLHRAVKQGYTDITAYCLEKLSSPPSTKDNAGYTPLHIACSKGYLDIVRLLLQYGANVSEAANGGLRPLHEAAENGNVEIVRLLLAYGADPLLVTYGGQTPLSLAENVETKRLLKEHMDDVQGDHGYPWCFNGPSSLFDSEEARYNCLEDPPSPDPPVEDTDIDVEVSESPLPPLYYIRGEPATELWVLWQDLSTILKIKSRDTLLKQINPSLLPNTNKELLKEFKMADFLEKVCCLQLMCAGEKINIRANKIVMIKFNDNVKQLLGIEKVAVTVR